MNSDLIWTSIVDECNASPFWTLMVDEEMDVSTTEQAYVCLSMKSFLGFAQFLQQVQRLSRL